MKSLAGTDRTALEPRDRRWPSRSGRVDQLDRGGEMRQCAVLRPTAHPVGSCGGNRTGELGI